MLTICMGSHSEQMLVKVTTSLKRMVHSLNSPEEEKQNVETRSKNDVRAYRATHIEIDLEINQCEHSDHFYFVKIS